MINNIQRIGSFTSSEIVALTSTDRSGKEFGAPAMTYIAETNMERILGRSLTDETTSRAISWGNLLEPRVFDLLGLNYTYSSKITDTHPVIDYWSGSKDGTNEAGERAVIDLKCPLTLKSFCGLVMPLYFGYEGIQAMDCIRNGFEEDGFKYAKHKDGDKFYWQLVSNSIINNTDFAELIVYMPYQSELLEIKKLADGNPSVYWLNYANEDEIPYLIDGGMFKNINIIRFEVPQADKDLLTANVLKAGKMLIDVKKAA